jgi:phosphotransferase system enzyme I (PtsI)
MKKGIIASKGYAIGTVFLKSAVKIQVGEEKAASPAEEVAKLQRAIEAARSQLIKLREKTEVEVGEAEAAIFDSHLQFLDDPEFTGVALSNIQTEKITATKAIRDIVAKYIEVFAAIDDEYLRERVADLKDVGGRLLQNLQGNFESGFNGLPENAVVVAHDLTPSDTAQMDKSKVVAFVTDIGGPTSHSAIMARSLEIPAVVGTEDITKVVNSGDRMIVDGVEGVVVVNPDPETVAKYREKQRAFEMAKQELQKLIHTPTLTKNGKHVILAANIGKPEDVAKALAVGAEAIGLFRTEFLYMEREKLPTEAEQFQAYKQVAEAMAGKPVVIRTLDIGGDKQLAYLPLAQEMNPFLGLRAIRLCLARPELFKTQLRSLLKASAYGDIHIMFPMIGSVAEFRAAKELVHECMRELQAEGIPYNEQVPIGLMIEIPAAALVAAELAKEADFFSIGTNDLIQYTLAVDRMNESVSSLYNPMHPAVLRLIRMTIAAAHKEGIWCGMCGEMAGDVKAVPTLLAYGLDEFSMSAATILEVRRIIINY